MRTTSKRRKELMRELRAALRVRTNHETWAYTSAFASLLKSLNPHKAALTFGHYANGEWASYWLDENCRERFVYFDNLQWLHDPLLAAQRVADCPN